MRHPLSLFIIALMAATTVVMGATICSQLHLVQAQPLNEPETAAFQIYTKLPDFPKENQYQHRKKKAIADDNTLISRLIRYHTYVKGRSPNYRLDWKITLADFLGLNDYIAEKEYPGATFLRPNPLEQDQHIIQQLDRQQRNELIQAIVDVYNPSVDETP